MQKRNVNGNYVIQNQLKKTLCHSNTRNSDFLILFLQKVHSLIYPYQTNKKFTIMILTKTYPANKSLTNVFDELFNAFPTTWGNDVRSNSAAPVNINETKNGYDLEFNVPGRNKEDFTINVENGLLTVGFEKKAQADANEVKSVRKEWSLQNFKRSFNLDEKINAEGIEAKYENGILKIYLPKKEEVKNAPKQISIQ